MGNSTLKEFKKITAYSYDHLRNLLSIVIEILETLIMYNCFLLMLFRFPFIHSFI